MKNKLLKITSGLMASLLIVTSLAACVKKEEVNNPTSQTNVTQETKKEETKEEVKLPLEKPITIKVWQKLNANVANITSDFSKTDFSKELEKRTGVKVEYIHPTMGQEKEQLNLMLAARDLPDVFFGGIYEYGQIKAFREGFIIEFGDLQNKYAPNLSRLYSEFPTILTDVSTEDGKIIAVPSLRGNSMEIFQGGIMRKDWLDELKLEVPTTIDEWTTTLRAFKEKKNAQAPFTGAISAITNLALMGAFDIKSGYFVDNGKVVYGQGDPRYKQYLTTLASWYKEGLLDAEFATVNGTLIDAKFTNGQSGAIIGMVSSGIGKYLTVMKDKDAKYDLVGVPIPSLKEGETVRFANVPSLITGSEFGYITTANKFPKETMAWLDYSFTKEGTMLNNWGVEGVSYEMVNGKPVVKTADLLREDKVNMLFNYARQGAQGGPYVKMVSVSDSIIFPQQTEAVNTWSKNAKEAINANTTLKMFLTEEEENQVKSKLAQIKTYTDEMFLKFVMGNESMDNFDKYMGTLKQIGLEDVLKVYQAAYDRFVKNFPDSLKPLNGSVGDLFR